MKVLTNKLQTMSLDYLRKHSLGEKVAKKYNVPIRFTVDYDKCSDSTDCNKCVAACPNLCLTMFPTNPDRLHWGVSMWDPLMCNLCGVCARACPKEAVKVERIDGVTA